MERTGGSAVIIYADILIIVNAYVNYFLLLTCARMTHRDLSYRRGLFAAIIGSFSAFIILLPPIHIVLLIIMRFIIAGIIISAAFGFSSWKQIFQLTMLFFIFSFFFAGIMLAIAECFPINKLKVQNGVFYFDFSIIILILATILSYMILMFTQRFFSHRNILQRQYRVIITANERTVSLQGLIDTGNTLKDVFTGRPVIICNVQELMDILPAEYPTTPINSLEEIETMLYNNKKKLRELHFIPFNTIDVSGTLPIFHPEKIYISETGGHMVKKVDAMVGLNTTNQAIGKAIFHPNLIM